MLASELQQGAGINIIVNIGMQSLEFSTKVAQVLEGGCLYAEPILQNEKMLGFGTKGLVLNMLATDSEGGRAWLFSNVKIRNIKTAEGELFHEIICKTEGKAINRRAACRVWLGESGSATVGLGNPFFDVTIKDISVSGISFICSKDQEISVGSVVRLSFKDSETFERFELSAIVVRCVEMEKSRMLYGCKLNQEVAAVGKYINDKQRKKLAASRQIRLRSMADTDSRKKR